MLGIDYRLYKWYLFSRNKPNVVALIAGGSQAKFSVPLLVVSITASSLQVFLKFCVTQPDTDARVLWFPLYSEGTDGKRC